MGNVRCKDGRISGNVPKHVVIIPDGNRRWARRHGLPILEGHRRGIEKIRNVMNWCKEYGINYLSMWGFSSENFNRPRDEVIGLIKLFDEYLDKALEEVVGQDVRIKFYGRLDRFPKGIRGKMMALENESARGRYCLNLFLGYGGRQEIIDAVNRIISDVKRGRLRVVDEKTFSSYLYTSDLPDPDLVIRTSGELRTSGFMPWQTVYSEFWFTKKLWPDFTKQDFVRAIRSYAARERRFGR